MADTKWKEANPWLGLRAYGEGQRLFGREKETAALTDIIVSHEATVVYGKSGVGKSSLLRAAIFPELRKAGFVPVAIRLEHDTDISYAEQVQRAIADNLEIVDLLPPSVPPLGLWDFLHRHRFTTAGGQVVTPVVVFDQFEEIFTLTQGHRKAAVQAFFSELADVLNDVKPDRVLQAEAKQAQLSPPAQDRQQPSGFTLHALPASSLQYVHEAAFRIVISLRDDSLYLLESVSATIPALKVNRYNLRPLSEQGAMDVIVRPRPELFSQQEARTILDELAYYEYDGQRVVEPAIISLFLYTYYKEQGRTSYDDIFERYYAESIQPVSNRATAVIEESLLTSDGYRTQVPYDTLVRTGVKDSELAHLLACVILKKERRGQVDYYEFSHDLLCREAIKHRRQQVELAGRRKLRRLAVAFAAVMMGGIAAVALLWPKQTEAFHELRLRFAEGEGFSSDEHWEARFHLLPYDADTLLHFPVQTPKGTLVESLTINRGRKNEYVVVVPESFLKASKWMRVQIYETSKLCKPRTDTIELKQWLAAGEHVMPVERMDKVKFGGRVIDTRGQAIEGAMVVLGKQPMQFSLRDGSFTFYLEDSTELANSNIYAFKEDYSPEKVPGRLLLAAGKGLGHDPLLMQLTSTKEADAPGGTDSSEDAQLLFRKQLEAFLTLYSEFANYNNRQKETIEVDSAKLSDVLKVYPYYALQRKNLTRFAAKTDNEAMLYCVTLTNGQADGFRDITGNYYKHKHDYLFQGKFVRRGEGPYWYLEAVAHDIDGRQLTIRLVLERKADGNYESVAPVEED